MRSTQNFDPLKVEVVQHDTSVDAEVNTVSENAYGGVDRWDRAVDAEAPDSEIGIARCRTHILELDVGNVVAQTLKILDELGIQLRFTKSRDRHRYFLHAFAIALFWWR